MIRPAALLALLALSACGTARVYGVEPVGNGLEGLVAEGTGGEQPVEIYGAPPDGAPPEAVAAALEAPARLPSTTYRPAGFGETPLRLVLAFDRASAIDACVAPSAGAQGADGLQLALTFCNGREAVSSALLTAPGVAGPSDPAFAAEMRRAIAAVYSTQGQKRGGPGR